MKIQRKDLKFLGACAAELGLGCIAIGLGWMFGLDPRNRMPSMLDFPGIAMGVGMGAIAGALLAFLMMLVPKIPFDAIQSFNEKTVRQLVRLLNDFSTPQMIAVALTAGVGEELLFRGWLMQALTGNMRHCSWEENAVGIAISSLAFGFAHPINWTYVVLATLMGSVFGILYWYFDNLLVPIAAHWIYDAIIMIWLMRSQKAPE
ncbi:MAG: CPBP family intramembrane glutamic endopeptidase [Pirellula sp.]